MNARELALELATLERDQREQLLAELPLAKRDELRRLIDELRPLLGGTNAFAAIMGDLRTQADRSARLLADPATLAQLLRGETVAIKKQLHEVFVNGTQGLLTDHVRRLVADHLEAQAQHLPAPPAPARRTSGWRRFWS